MSLVHMALTFPKCSVSLGIEGITSSMLMLNVTFLGLSDATFFPLQNPLSFKCLEEITEV